MWPARPKELPTPAISDYLIYHAVVVVFENFNCQLHTSKTL